ncbi:MAG: ribonuclease III [candidate division WWE3 bacterium]|nr:ribonuclease III [candidate division WWE3 bacterium]
MDFSKAETIIGLEFKNKELVATAFTHRSYLNEHSNYQNPSNERLEFLGDSILQFLTSEFLFNNYPREPEGMLTSYRAAAVCTVSLAAESAKLGYGNFLLLSHGEEASGGRTKEYLLANTFEAVLGAIYMDSFDIDFCRRYLLKNLFYKLDEIVKNESYRDFKSRFQEEAQEKKGLTPQYKVLDESGPDHDKKFAVGVFLGNTKAGEGEGSSKQRAEQAAAENALANLDNIS